jgi:hypothetical protein
MGAFDDLLPQKSGGSFNDLIPKRKPDAFDNPNMAADVPWYENLAAGAGKDVADAGRGLGQIVGLTSQQDIDEAKKRDAALMGTGAGVTGNILGGAAMLAPTALIPGAGTVAGAGIIGGVQGALLNGGSLEERLKEGALGAAGGAVGAGVANALGKVKFGPSDAVKTLRGEGVGITPGQNLGGMFQRTEDKLTSIPLVGDVIQNARNRGVEDLNRAALSRGSMPARGALPAVNAGGEIGGEGLSNLRTGLSSAYDNVLATSNVNALDPAFVNSLAAIRAKAQGLPADLAKDFDNVLQREIGTRMGANGDLTGESLKKAVSALRTRGGDMKNSTDIFQRDLGVNIKESAAELMNLVRSVNPQNAQELAAIDKAYGNFKIAQKAAARVGAEEGTFTPAQLHSAVFAKDKTLDKRAFSEGTALMQDLSAPAKKVLASKTGDSGTAGRMWLALLASGGTIIPAAAATAAAYSRPGQYMINGVVNGPRYLAELARRGVAANPAYAGAAGMSLANLVR